MSTSATSTNNAMSTSVPVVAAKVLFGCFAVGIVGSSLVRFAVRHLWPDNRYAQDHASEQSRVLLFTSAGIGMGAAAGVIMAAAANSVNSNTLL